MPYNHKGNAAHLSPHLPQPKQLQVLQDLPKTPSNFYHISECLTKHLN
jgi:hypothetical protein